MTVMEHPPAVPPAVDWSFPSRREHRLDNGLTVLVYNCPGQFVVTVSVLFDVPLSGEPRDREGVAGLTGGCLTKGAGGRAAEEFADAIAVCGADVDASASPDGFGVRLSVPLVRLSEGLALMADMVQAPTFDEAEFAQQKRQRLQEIEQSASYPQHVAVEQLNAALFGAARAARSVGGAADTVAQVERADMVAYARQHFQPSQAAVVAAGDFAGVDPFEAVSEAFAGWQHVGGDRLPGEAATVVADRRVLLVDWPEAPQATIRVGGRGITRNDARWPAMFVANFAVGGSFSSRLNTVLREEKGYTYGANSGLDTGRHGGLFTVATAVRSDAAAESVGHIVSILEAAAGTINADETATAIRAVTDSAALGFERAGAVVGRVEMLLNENLPLDHVDANLSRIRRVTPESANEAYAGVLDPGSLIFVVVGDAAMLRPSLETLAYAPVDVISPPRR